MALLNMDSSLYFSEVPLTNFFTEIKSNYKIQSALSCSIHLVFLLFDYIKYQKVLSFILQNLSMRDSDSLFT
jgi:hypothetical protein